MADHGEKNISELDISSLFERVAIIEKNSPTQEERAITKFGARAGLFATILSILTGAFAIFSQLYVQPNQEKDKTFQQFTTYIQQLASSGSRLATVARSTPDPIERQALIDAINTETIVALDGAEQLLPAISNRISAPQFVLLAEAKMNEGGAQEARIYLSKAVDKAEGSIKSDVLRIRGRVSSQTGNAADQASAMADYANALIILESIGQWGVSIKRASVLHDWIIGESQFGSCVKANELLPRFLEEVRKPDISVDTRAAYIADLKQIVSAQSRCPINLSSLQ